MTKQFPKDGLQNLIRNKQLGRKMPELSSDCGGIPTVKNLSRLINAEHKELPSPEVIRGLARGLRVRVIDVLKAAAISTGLSVQAEDSKDLIIPDGASLPAESRKAVLEMAEHLLWWNESLQDAMHAQGATPGVVDGSEGSLPDNVHQLPTSSRASHAADSEAGKTGGRDIDPDQLPDE